ncbi:MAG: ZIP family metal transporter [Candidatus Nomurabacteria bacterium]|jgi:zinc and cadmium transporter|nr:ZIP family metal transporter [Candidatus Nomurabacteria bacterium]
MLLQVIICSLAGGLFSLIGGIILTLTGRARSFASYTTAFAAGALIAAAFVDMLPEALEGSGDPQQTLLFAMGGLVFFFLLEGAVNWFHKHSHHESKLHPVVPMIVLGDTIHNFIDGIAIAAGFLIDPASGVIVTLAVAAHELPQEIGDFAIMLDKGVKRRKVILINILSSLVTTAAAVIFFLLGEHSDISLAPLVAIVAGFFIYIAATDIIPTIHGEKSKKNIWKKSLLLLVGVLVVSFVIIQLHGVIDKYSGHDEHEHTHSLVE